VIPCLVFSYIAIGLAVRLWLTATWLRMGVPRRHEDQFYDFIMCVAFWPISAWLVWGMWRSTKKGAA
jgi:hypothetical protein